MFGWLFRTLDPGNYEYENDADKEERSKKEYADSYTEACYRIRNEKDPLKREKMENRLALGITDFSDL